MRWIKHLSMAHADRELGLISEEFGAEGYGVYWLMVEDIAATMETGKMEPISLHSVVKWAQICHCSVRRWRSIADSLAKKRLIYIETIEDRFSIKIPNIMKYKDEYAKRSAQTPEQEHIQIEKQNTDREQIETNPITQPVVVALPVALVPVAPKDEIAAWYDAEFYPAFPLHKSREQGLKAARVHLRTPALRDRAMSSLRSQLPELQSREPSKRPYPASWINGKRWEDEPDPLFVPVPVGSEIGPTQRAIDEGNRRMAKNGRLY